MGVDLSVDLGRIRLRNPVLAASGTFGYGEEYADLLDFSQIGGIITKSITLHPRVGNPSPRVVETAAGMLNAIGLANVGVGAFLDEKMAFLRRIDTPVIVNVSGATVEEYVEVARRLNGSPGIVGLEINVSCPNVAEGGMAFGADPSLTSRVISEVRRVTDLPLIAKLTPNVTDIAIPARAAEESGADALSLINTLVGMAVDVDTRRPELANITGGLSGPAIKPVALAMVWKVVRAVSIPVIGIGGIVSGEDAMEFLIIGARAVQVGTANFLDPSAMVNIARGIERYCRERGISRVSEVIGSLEESQARGQGGRGGKGAEGRA